MDFSFVRYIFLAHHLLTQIHQDETLTNLDFYAI